MSEELEFSKALSVIAEICGRPISKDGIIYYFENLKDLGIKRVTVQIKKMGRNGKLPTIDEIRHAMGADVDMHPKIEAANAAERIWGCIVKHGYNNPGRAETDMGELAWEIVRSCGGWVSVCDIESNDQKPAMIAQWRDLGQSIIERRRAGKDDRPELPNRSALPQKQSDPTNLLR